MSIWVADLEANGLLDTATKVHCGVFRNYKTGEIHKFYPGSHDDYVKAMLSFMDTIKVLVMHNGIGYDWPLLEKLYGYSFKGKKIDTLIMSRLFNPDRRLPFNCPNKRAGPHSVEAWGYRVGRGKPEHDDWENFSEAMLHRCSEDVEIQCLIYDKLLEEMRATGADWRNALAMSHKLFEIVQKQEEYGWLVDRPYAERCIRLLTEWMDRIDRHVGPRLPKVLEVGETKSQGEYKYVAKPFKKDGTYAKATEDWISSVGLNATERPVLGPYTRISFRPLDLGKRNETVDFLLKSGWIPKEWNTNDAGERTSPKLSKTETFEGVQGSMGRLIAKRVVCRQRRGIIEGWLRAIRPDGRLPGRITGLANTGRAKHAVIVNVPGPGAFFGKQMRKIFIAKDGYVLIGTDAASCQDRMLAQRASNPDFTNMLLDGDKSKGTDGHSLATKAVNAALDIYGKPHIPRKIGKNFNFGWKFGASDGKLGKMVQGGPELGSLIREKLEQVFPAQAALVERLETEWRKNAKRRMGKWGKPELYNGWITGLDGRPVLIESPHAVLVYCLQSDEAIYMTYVYCLVYQQMCKRWKWGEDFGIVCFYHDEVTVEIKAEYAEEAAQLIEKCFTVASNHFNFDHCPQAGEAATGHNWLEIH